MDRARSLRDIDIRIKIGAKKRQLIFYEKKILFYFFGIRKLEFLQKVYTRLYEKAYC